MIETQVQQVIDQHQEPLTCATALANYFKKIPRGQLEVREKAYREIVHWEATCAQHLQAQASPATDLILKNIRKRVVFCQLLNTYYKGDLVGMFKDAQGFIQGDHTLEDMVFLTQIHRMLAHICYVLGLVDLAIQHGFKALRYSETCLSEEETVKNLIEFGIIYSLVEDFNLQQEYFQEAIDRARRAGYLELARNATSNLAYISIQMGKVDVALKLIEEAEAVATDNTGNSDIGLMINRLRIALIQEDVELAARQIQSLESLKPRMADQSLVMDLHLLACDYHTLKSNDRGRCMEALDAGLQIALAINSKSYQKLFFEKIAECHYQTGNYRDAYALQKQALQLEAQMDKDRLSQQYLALRVQYEVDNIHREVVQLKQQASALANELEMAKYALNDTQEVTIYALATLAEYRDQVTGQHILRMVKYVERFCGLMLQNSIYTDRLTDDFVRDLSKSSSLHDIGKVGIADAILNKPGKLSKEEFEVIKTHTRIGRDALGIAEKILGHDTFLSLAMSIAYYHHEKWDGTGYPEGLRGDAIPFEARVVAILDVYDALISERPYKAAYTHEEAIEIMAKGVGSHFDPQLSTLFIQHARDFYTINQVYSDDVNL